MSEWTFSFTMAIGTGPSAGTGIEREATTGHGIVSKAAECPMRCALYLLIFATPYGTTNGFDTLTSRGTGRSGSTRNTGTDPIIGARYEMGTTVGDGKTTMARPIVDTKYETPVTTRGGKQIGVVQKGK